MVLQYILMQVGSDTSACIRILFDIHLYFTHTDCKALIKLTFIKNLNDITVLWISDVISTVHNLPRGKGSLVDSQRDRGSDPPQI